MYCQKAMLDVSNCGHEARLSSVVKGKAADIDNNINAGLLAADSLLTSADIPSVDISDGNISDDLLGTDMDDIADMLFAADDIFDDLLGADIPGGNISDEPHSTDMDDSGDESSSASQCQNAHIADIPGDQYQIAQRRRGMNLIDSFDMGRRHRYMLSGSSKARARKWQKLHAHWKRNKGKPNRQRKRKGKGKVTAVDDSGSSSQRRKPRHRHSQSTKKIQQSAKDDPKKAVLVDARQRKIAVRQHAKDVKRCGKDLLDHLKKVIGARQIVCPNRPKNPESIEQKATRAANATAAKRWKSADFAKEFVGIDPGRLAAWVAARLDDPSWTCSLSTREYYELCGFKNDMAQTASEIDGVAGLRDWMSRMPTAKTATSQETLQRLRYTYRSEHFRELMELSLDIKKRIRRWETYKRQQRVIAEACQRLTHGLIRDTTVICVGDGKFSTSSRGYCPSPTMSRLVEYLCRDGWHVIYVWEFNTSQVCSHCCRQFEDDYMPYKMCKVGDAADGHAYYYKPKKSHFTRHCTVCNEIWNRDVNAAHNIAYLGMLQYYMRQRPRCFSKRLQDPPTYVVRRQLAQSAQAVERAAAAFGAEAVTPTAAEDIDIDMEDADDDYDDDYDDDSEDDSEDDAEAHRERKAQAMADIVASPQRFIEALAKVRPARTSKKVTKGLEKREGQKAASTKAKMKGKRSADSSKAASAPKKAKTKKAKTKKPASKKKD
ncbi:hypothetical protein GGI17_003296 [Coemansia sp. S146]|nr:hypothetical protein GGI17_003296 [Coemansia sp. S146]